MHTQTQTHEAIARQVAADPTALPVRARISARQGDLIIRRITDADPAPLPMAAIRLAAGNHGEHWAIGPCALEGDTLTVAKGAVIVHTDAPDARHRAIAPAPGVWQIGRQRELGMDQVVRKVVD